jgi:GT2 family glycosyltransferase
VAAIVVTRDRPELLADALRTIESQDPPAHELRVANDGEQPIEDVVAALGVLEVTIVPVSVHNPGAARNRAAAGSRAEVLAFLDDDDRWLAGHLAGLAAAFLEPETTVAYRDCAVVRERLEPGGGRVELERRLIARDWDPAVMAVDDYVPPSALAIRRSAFERLGGFDESFAFSEDWDLLLRAAAEAAPRRVPGVTVEVRMRAAGHLSADRGPERQACLDRLAARHRLAPLTIKTFWEVARDVAIPADSPRRGAAGGGG